MLPAADLETEDHYATGKGAMAQGKEKKCCLFLAGNKGKGGKGIVDKRTCFVKTYKLTKVCLNGVAAWLPGEAFAGHHMRRRVGLKTVCVDT